MYECDTNITQCMYLIAHADGCEVSVTSITTWSTKYNHRSSITVIAPPSNGEGG